MPNDAREWEQWAARDPYFAVLTEERFRAANLNREALASFFASGTAYVAFLQSLLRDRFASSLPLRRILDFGCGVGRLTIPFARVAEDVVAVDVSRAMLVEARRNAEDAGVTGIRFLHVDEFLREELTPFDLVNSYITFQHVPPRQGELLYDKLLSGVRPSGFAAIHLLHSRPGPLWKRIAARLRANVPAANAIANLLLGKPIRTPYMRMEPYDVNRFLRSLQKQGYGHAHSLFTDHGGYRGVLVVASRASDHVP
ncbi:MAG TPA: class I SAM-dependent methyltransferase [Thermoanaerobaculia bacterium]